MDSLQPSEEYCEMVEPQFPVIESLAEVPHVTRGSNHRLAMTVDERKEMLYIISTEGCNCHVLAYSCGSSSNSMVQKTSLVFDQEVEAAELYRHDAHVCAIVVTRDGRLWHGALHSLEKGTFPYDSIFTENPLKQRLLGVNLLSVCQDCTDGPAVAAVVSTLSPPQVLWLGSGEGGDTDIVTGDISGLDHIHSPFTSVLFLSREKTTSSFWSMMTRVPSCKEIVESILVLGFADGAIRSCMITDSKLIHPVHLLARLDSVEQEVVSILALTASGRSNLMDTLCFVGRSGAVSTLNDYTSLQCIPGGLRLRGPWTSAAVVQFADKSGILATRHDGTSHLFVLSTKDSMCVRLPIRSDMMSVNSYMTPQGTWVSFGTVDGSVLLVQMTSSILEKLSAWDEGHDVMSAGILDKISERPQTTSADRTHRLLQRLRRYDQAGTDTSMSVYNGESASRLNIDLQRAMDTTNLVLKVAHVSCNEYSENVAISEENDVITVRATPVNGLIPPSPGGSWISSLHACYGSESDGVPGCVQTIRRRENESGLPVHYGGVAVTDSRTLGECALQSISFHTDGMKTTDAFLSVAHTHEPNDNEEHTGIQAKRKKTGFLVDPPTSFSRDSQGETLIILL